MECNKDEAIRAKEIAEKKLTENDILGAKKFASKAESLFPGLEGLSQFLEILDIYAASERKVNGEVDWYEILGVHPLADDETIRKKYRKLALALHPDKNKAVGADGAFKILSEAWSLLSDKVKRTAYNEKRNLRALYQKLTGQNPPGGVEKNVNESQNPPGGVEKNVNENFTNKSSTVRKTSSPANPQTDSVPPKPNTNTFWTRCKRCMMQYEFVDIYQNQNLLCPNCRQPFVATEIPPPSAKNRPASTPWSHFRQQQGGCPANNASSDSGRKFPPTPITGTPGFSGVGLNTMGNVPQGSTLKFGCSRSMSTPAKSAAQPAYTFQPMGENLKRGREEAVSGRVHEEFQKSNTFKKTDSGLPFYNVSTSGKGEKSAKKSRIDEHKMSVGAKDMVNQIPQGNRGSGRGKFYGNQMGKYGAEVIISRNNQPKSLRELSQSETRDMLIGKAKMEIRKKLQEWNMAAALKSSGKAGLEAVEKPTSVNALQKSVGIGMKKTRIMNTSIKDANNSVRPKKSSFPSVTPCSDTAATARARASNLDGLKGSLLSASTTGSNTEATEILTMDVPDPEFYDFDKDRIEESFAESQVWAAYGDEDGMPRYYAIVHDVMSRKPFKVRISWLNSKSNSEFGPLNWIGCGFSKTCGNFRIGKHEVNKTLNSFSHMVKWTKGAKGVIQILPKKGDVWALYRNWSSAWNELTPNDVIHQYDMVEVLQDYNEERGVSVAPLVKVAGFKSVFHQHLDTTKIYTIPREEMFRFSHQVASYILTGQEAQTAPKGCRELDTAALPLELLKIVKDDKEGEGGRTAEEVSATGDADAVATTGDAKHVVTEKILMYSRKAKGKKVVGDTIEDKEETRSAGAN